jgi:hypothetical protein
LGHGVSAPSTLGTFLRAFTFGHVRQLDRVLADCLERAWAAGPGPGEDRLVVDVDSFVGEVYGYDKQGAGYGYTHKRGYHPILATRSGTGEALAHFPSGRVLANAAWTVIAALAHNLLKWTTLIGLPDTVIPDRPDHPPPAAERSWPGYPHRPDSDTPDAGPMALGDRLPHRPPAPPCRAAAHLKARRGNQHDRPPGPPASACPEHHDHDTATTPTPAPGTSETQSDPQDPAQHPRPTPDYQSGARNTSRALRTVDRGLAAVHSIAKPTTMVAGGHRVAICSPR